MSKEKLVPKLRFEEFKSCPDWEKYVIGDLMNVTSVKRIHQSDWKSSGVRFLRARDIVADYKKENMDEYLYISKERYEEYSRLSGKVQKGDLLVTGVGTIGVPYLVKDESPLYFKDGNIIWFKNNNQIEGNFLYNYFVGSRIQEYINNAAGIGTVGTYTITSGQKTPILLPNYSEQNKIGTFFKKIDEMIQVQQSKVNKVKDIKSAYLSEMFPKEGEKYPKKRFEGFTEPWMVKKLGSLLGYEQPTDYLVKSDSYDDSYLTPVLTAGKSFLLGYTNETEGIYKADNNNGVIIFDDFTTSSHFVDFDFKVKSSAMKFLRTNQSNFNLYFLYNLLTSINYSPESHERHWISIFSEFEVLVPTKKEQEKIAQLFKNLDNQISIEEKKLAKLENLKQGYLNDMFV